jgi:hypothetical protein
MKKVNLHNQKNVKVKYNDFHQDLHKNMDEQAHVGDIYNKNILEMTAKKPNWDMIKEDLIEMQLQDIHAN